mmetsp:Transcript_28291/g.34965  ORF Transcript_28291/g.34965 Transcript_28291/m.34965 type:complete len:291 (+) Transcript_28291:126-998(+)
MKKSTDSFLSRSQNSSSKDDSESTGNKGSVTQRLFPSLSVTMSSHSKFLDLFEKQQWKTIRKRLNSRNAHQFVKLTGSFGITVLSLALGHEAPIDIVERILDLEPALPLQKDVLGASPLHVACLNGAPLPAIKLLIDQYPFLVPDVDGDNRTPLHHAVEYICKGGQRHENKEEALAVVKELLRVSPEIVHWGDVNGDSPLDLIHIDMVDSESIQSSIDSNEYYDYIGYIYQYLKMISIELYIHQKKGWEERGYNVKCSSDAKSTSKKSQETEETESLFASDSNTTNSTLR